MIWACPIQLPRTSSRSCTSMHNTVTPSSFEEHRAAHSALIHQRETTSMHVLSHTQAELLAALGRTGGKDRNRDGEEQWKGREEGRFLYKNTGESQKGQQRNGGRRSKLQQEQRQLMALPEVPLQNTGIGHLRAMATSSLCSYKKEVKGEKMRGSKYHSRRHKVTEISSETGKGGRELCCFMERAFPSHSNSCVRRMLALQGRAACKPKAEQKKENEEKPVLGGNCIVLNQK